MPLFALLWTESQSKWVHWCRLLEKYNAGLVQPKNVEELVSRLGNPLYFVVNQPDEAIEQNIVPGKSNEIPPEAFHLVLLNTYFCQIPNQPCKYNVLEINVLGSGGGEMPGYERTYFPVHRVQSWITKHCKLKGRKKHVLSALHT